MSELKGFDGTLKQVGGSIMVIVPSWLIKAERLEEGKQYRFYVEVSQ